MKFLRYIYIIIISILIAIIIAIWDRPPVIKTVVEYEPVFVETIREIIVEIEKEPTYAYNITSEEREMLARLVYREANVESLECQKAIVSVIINRWQNGRWGDTLEDVVYAKNQFTPADLLYKTTPNERNYEAVDWVLKNGTTLPEYVLYFRANYHFDWSGYHPYTHIDKTYFGYLEKDKKEIN